MPEPTETMQWGDMMEDLDGEGSLPTPTVDVKGNTKTLVEFRVNDDGKKEKVTRIFNLETIKVSKSIARRKAWKKFGLATRDNPNGPDHSTTVLGEDVFLTFTTNKEELDEQVDEQKKKLQATGGVKCRTCKGDHWTTQCPYKDSMAPLLAQDKEKTEEAAGAANPEAAKGGVQGNKYVPPSMRAGAEQSRGSTMNSSRRQDEDATLRVTNLSEDACESDIQELFRPFGSLARVYLAKCKITNQSKGFAFVSYNNREDAARAIAALQGYGYDHLILNVEWAKPSNNH